MSKITDFYGKPPDGGSSVQEVVEVTADFDIDATNADKVISNAGATAAANNSVKSTAKFDYVEYLKVSADPARWICTSAIPSASAWVDQLDGE